MEANEFKQLFEDQEAANQLYIDILFPRKEEIAEYAYKMMWHNHMAQHVWSCRILKKEFEWSFDQDYDLDILKKVIQDNREKLSIILDTMDLSTLIEYKNIKGEAFQSVLSDILLHVSHHYHYHRGQIARCVREAGMVPPATDLIIWRRKKLD